MRSTGDTWLIRSGEPDVRLARITFLSIADPTIFTLDESSPDAMEPLYDALDSKEPITLSLLNADGESAIPALVIVRLEEKLIPTGFAYLMVAETASRRERRELGGSAATT